MSETDPLIAQLRQFTPAGDVGDRSLLFYESGKTAGRKSRAFWRSLVCLLCATQLATAAALWPVETGAITNLAAVSEPEPETEAPQMASLPRHSIGWHRLRENRLPPLEPSSEAFAASEPISIRSFPSESQ